MKFDCRLWKASQLHSQDMADQAYFSHTSKDGRSPWDRAAAQGVRSNGENIAAGSSTAQRVLDQWKNSDGHCKNMGNAGFKLFAVGYASGGPYGHYWTQMFASREDGLDTSCYPEDSLLMIVNEHFESATSAPAPAPASDEPVGKPWSSID
jgi:hypothetical protein